MNQMSLEQELKSNAYPRRGTIIGCSEDGTKAIAVYFVMGRSANSRSRVLAEDRKEIRTQIFDLTKLEDPSLTTYAPVRALRDKTTATNGDQTDTIYGGMDHQMTFE